MSLFIPQKIKVGYQERSDTYSGKLAYVIYYDTKGKLRKEASWNSWRDKEIQDNEWDNTPISGFVLNKKVGGYQYHYDMRQTYARVYDPRGFEIEITVPNLLHILECTDCIRGKGLVGDFVYAWDGTELVLLPTSSPNYEELQQKTTTLLTGTPIKGSELKPGRTYTTINGEEFVFLKKSPKINYSVSTYHFPLDEKLPPQEECYTKTANRFWFMNGGYLTSLSSVTGKFYSCVDENVHPNYQEYIEKLESDCEYCPIDFHNTEINMYTYDEFLKLAERDKHVIEFLTKDPHTNRIFSVAFSIVNNNEQLYHYYNWGWRSRSISIDHPWWHKDATLREIFNYWKPFYINTYLTNGKFFRKET